MVRVNVSCAFSRQSMSKTADTFKLCTAQRPGGGPSHERTTIQHPYQLFLCWLYFHANTIVRALFSLLFDASAQQSQKHTSQSTYQTIRLYICLRVFVGGDFHRNWLVNPRSMIYIFHSTAGASQRLVGRNWVYYRLNLVG